MARTKIEADVVNEIRLAFSKAGIPVWRNHVGGVKHENGNFARSGLAVGSADLVGVLTGPGTFIALEVKHPTGGRTSERQRAWLEVVRRCGGIAGVVRSVAEAFALIGRKQP
jgi:hypothetical protein